VDVAGTFNNWNRDHDPMILGVDGKTWTLQLRLPYGKVDYKFVVNGTDWILDPLGKSVPDGDGHMNSEVVVTPPDYAQPASPSDGITATSALFYEPEEPYLNYDRGNLEIEFRARTGDLAGVDLVANGTKVPMKSIAHDDLFETYEAKTRWDRAQNISYYFRLRDGAKTAYYSLEGYGTSFPSAFTLQADTFRPYVVPAWTAKAVVYQIFPDRFADGDPTNDPKDVEPFGATPTYSNRFGGDAVGVEQHLDYLKALGIGAVYFNPVFASPSNHRYDTTDYLKIDPEFGTNQEFDHLAKTLKSNGIGTVMDFAFNHTSPTFFAFQDIEKNGPASPYLDWYFIKSFPVVARENPPYVAWDNYPSMPKLNVVNPATEKYILGVVDYWRTHADIAGVRLDVANEVNPKLWQDLRAHEKAEQPSFWIVGEEWGNADPWLRGDQWDSTMGYEFRAACLDFFANRSISPSKFVGRLTSLYAEYPPQVSRNLMNLLGSHDTPRFLTLCKGDERLLELAATVQLTWPGTPCIYYGDELGMKGGVDPDNRRTMDWKSATQTNPVLKYYKTLIAVRNHSIALQQGDPKILFANDSDGTFAFARSFGNDAAIVVVNDSTMKRTETFSLPENPSYHSLKHQAIDAITGERYSATSVLSITLPPLGAAVLIPQEDLDLASSPKRDSLTRRLILSGHRSPNKSQGAI
jgi:cyclomaltodextrinase